MSDAKPSPIRRLYNWVMSFADSRYGPLALFILAFAESSFFPLPPDPLLLALCLAQRKRALYFGLLTTLGSVLGGLFGYWIGYQLWGALETTFYDWIPGFTPEKFETIKGHYEEDGVFFVFLAGFSPLPYKVFTVASGVMEMNILGFAGASLVGRGARFFVTAMLSYYFGEKIRDFIETHLGKLVWVFTILLVLGFVVLKYMH